MFSSKIIFKIKRWWSYTTFLFKLPAWDEDYEVLEVLLFQLKRTYKSLEWSSSYGSQKVYLQRLKLTIRLLEEYLDHPKDYEREKKLFSLIMKLLEKYLHTWWI